MRLRLLLSFIILFSATAGYAAINEYNSSVSLSCDQQTGNGQARVNVNIWLKDDAGVAVSDKQFEIRTDNPLVFPWSSGQTDSSGYGYGYIWSSTVTAVNIWVEAGDKRIYPNLVSNAGFETSAVTPTSWTAVVSPQWLTGYSSIDTSGYSSSKSLKVFSDSTENYIVFRQDVVISTTTSSSYAFTGMVYSTYCFSSDGGGYVNIDFYRSDGMLIKSSSSATVNGNVGWKQVTTSSVTVPETASVISATLEITNCTGLVKFDALKLIKIPSISFVNDRVAPSKPSNLTAIAGPNNGEVTLSWTEPGNDGSLWKNEDGYYMVQWFRKADWPFTEGVPQPINVYSQSWLPGGPGQTHNEVMSGLPYGENICIWFSVYDKYGNECSSATIDDKFSIRVNDNSTPISVFTCSNDFSKSFNTSYPEFSGTSVPGSIVHIAVDQSVLVSTVTTGWDGYWRYKATHRLGEGSHSVALYSDDGNGNRSLMYVYEMLIESLPAASTVNQSYPNPVTLSKTGKVTFPVNVKSDTNVKLVIYNVNGVIVKNLYDNPEMQGGVYNIEWDGKTDNGDIVESGVYYLYYKIGPDKGTMGFMVYK